MELGLSLGEASRSLSFFNKASKSNKGLGFCMDLDFGLSGGEVEDTSQRGNKVYANAPIQLELLPGSQYRCLPWTNEDGINEQGCSRGFDVNRLPLTEAMEGANETEPERASSRTSDDEENGLNRKKLRLSKEQSAFLEESFKEHHTLNPRQKLELAKQLNLRPRQVEVWFQNRRARTKLKQTEVDCEYLKRCCETLTEENKRLQKELQDLRVLKTSHPFYMQLPATTLTMCPSCERIATTNAPASGDSSAKTGGFTGLSKPVFFPFTPAHQSTSS